MALPSLLLGLKTERETLIVVYNSAKTNWRFEDSCLRFNITAFEFLDNGLTTLTHSYLAQVVHAALWKTTKNGSMTHNRLWTFLGLSQRVNTCLAIYII